MWDLPSIPVVARWDPARAVAVKGFLVGLDGFEPSRLAAMAPKTIVSAVPPQPQTRIRFYRLHGCQSRFSVLPSAPEPCLRTSTDYSDTTALTAVPGFFAKRFLRRRFRVPRRAASCAWPPSRRTRPRFALGAKRSDREATFPSTAICAWLTPVQAAGNSSGCLARNATYRRRS